MKKTLVLLLLSSYAFATSLEQVITISEPKVVKVGVVTDKGAGVCSGALISSTGIVLTCAHCFSHNGIKKVFIKTSEGQAYPAALLAIDPSRDLALIVPNVLGPFPYFKLGYEPVRGQQVVSFGSPLGIQHTATIGWVNNLIKQTYIYIYHSAFINPGSSGGPLVDLDGKLVGINQAIINYGNNQQAQGLYVAIDVITVKDFLSKVATR